MKILFGVTVFPYAHPNLKDGSPSKSAANTTTGDVAEYLENKYHIMEHFWQLRKETIVGFYEDSLAGYFESKSLGATSTMGIKPIAEANNKVGTLFRQFISSKALDGYYPGIPTAASLKGVDHRKAKNQGTPGRPSFKDTGLYMASFQAWTDET